MDDDEFVKTSIADSMREAPMTVHEYLRRAKSDIDDIFGAGYAQSNPELVSAYIQTAAADFNTGSMAKIFGLTLLRLEDIYQEIMEEKFGGHALANIGDDEYP